MDKRVLDNIISIIQKLNSEVINTRFYAKHIFQGDLAISQDQLEDFLRGQGYISIADDYMIRKSDFIHYCKSNGLDTVSKIKKRILQDKGIPYITLSEGELRNILNNNQQEVEFIIKEETEPTFATREEKKYILAEYPDGKYKIDNTKDLIRYGLENTYISYDLLHAFCRINPKVNQNEIVYMCSDRKIKLTSDDTRYVIEPIEEKRCKETSLMEKTDYIHVASSGVGSKINDLDILDPSKMMLALTQFGTVEANVFNKKELYEVWDDLHISRLLNTGILSYREGLYTVNKIAALLMNSIRENRFYKKSIYTSQRKNKTKFEELLYRDEKENIISMLLQNDSLYRFVNIIYKANLSNLNTMAGIAYYCNENNLDVTFIQLFLGEKASNGIKPMKKYRDVCFSCKNIYKCTTTINNIQGNKNKLDILLRYRNEYAGKCLDVIKAEQKINILLEKPIYLKFLVSYKLVVEIKPVLIKYGILKDDRILYKNSGIYCPFKDVWRVDNDILV